MVTNEQICKNTRLKYQSKTLITLLSNTELKMKIKTSL